MFYGYCFLVFFIDAIAAIVCKSAILLLPALLILFGLIISLCLFEKREKLKTARIFNLAVCIMFLIYGILGQTCVAVPISDYLIITAQALCGLLTVCTDIFCEENSK